jgi:hypothetical protein
MAELGSSSKLHRACLVRMRGGEREGSTVTLSSHPQRERGAVIGQCGSSGVGWQGTSRPQARCGLSVIEQQRHLKLRSP